MLNLRQVTQANRVSEGNEQPAKDDSLQKSPLLRSVDQFFLASFGYPQVRCNSHGFAIELSLHRRCAAQWSLVLVSTNQNPFNGSRFLSELLL